MLFQKDHRSDGTNRQKRVYAMFELAYTAVDFAAATLFVIGSIMFFSEDWQTQGTWMFLIGSICFALKPTLRLARELKLAAMGDVDDLAKRVGRD
ncbi:YrhK family protein [Lutimaribacter marinistellae]|uniref:YrhK family protein n=1 Tax=Lutimaribacter marinistellae TaxID=1820329 RepID=A0ABV7TG72_9RHOB